MTYKTSMMKKALPAFNISEHKGAAINPFS